MINIDDFYAKKRTRIRNKIKADKLVNIDIKTDIRINNRWYCLSTVAFPCWYFGYKYETMLMYYDENRERHCIENNLTKRHYSKTEALKYHKETITKLKNRSNRSKKR